MDTSPPPARDPGRSIGLRNWSVRSKLIAVLVIPAVAFLVLASFGISSLVGNAQAFEDGRRLAELGRQVTALVHELQAERDLSVAFTASAEKGVDNALSQQQPRTTQAVTAYRDAEAPLYEDLGEGVQGRFDAVRAGLADLALLRQSTRASSLTGRATSAEYSQIIDQLIDVNAEIAEPGGDEDLAQSVRALDDLSRAKEVTSQIRGILYALSFRDDFAFGGFQEFSSLLARQQAAFNQFQADANNQQRALFADVVQGQAVLQVDQIQQTTIRTQSGENINGPQWLAASTTNLELLRNVETRLLDGVIAQSGELSSTAQRDALRNAIAIAVILAIALLALLLVARSMAQPLQQLRARAIEIAERRLPDAVQRLRTTERGDLDVRVEPIGIDSRDEIGQVRAAAAEVEEYQRVELLPLVDLEVAGHVAVDVIHLLAELIENATAFSPPNTKVQIAGQAVPHGYVIEIEDRGLGMSDEELIQANERLANPPKIDFALSRVLGLYVVGRLGQRHGIKVQLRHSWYGGVTALTLLPNSLLVWPEVAQVGAADRAAAAAPGTVQGRGELPPPERGGNGAAAAAEPAPSGDHLPIFEAARSDWFVTEPSEPTPLPFHQRRQRDPRGD